MTALGGAPGTSVEQVLSMAIAPKVVSEAPEDDKAKKGVWGRNVTFPDFCTISPAAVLADAVSAKRV